MIIMLYIAAAAGLLYGFHPLVHALGKRNVTLEVGAEGNQVKAVLSENGTLTISGKGRTRDYTEETAPFAEYADQITAVKIQEGVTSVGDYLFYNCGNLRGRLTLPSSVIWIGDGAFSGEDQEHAPKFSVVESAFTEREIAFLKPGSEKQEKPQESGAAPSEATPGNAVGGPGETTGAETAPTENAKGPGEMGGTSVAPSESDSGEISGSTTAPSENGSGEISGPTTAPPESGPGEISRPTAEPPEIGPGETSGTSAVPSETGQEETAGAGGSPMEGSREDTPAESTKDSGKSTGNMEPVEATTQPANRSKEAKSGEGDKAGAGNNSSGGPEGTQIGQTSGEFTVSSGLLARGIRTFSLNTPEKTAADLEKEEEVPVEAESTEATTEAGTEGQESGENKQEEQISDADSQTKTASSSTAQNQEAEEEEETEPTEEFSEDGVLSNDLYEGAMDAAEVDESQRDFYTFETIRSQIVGMEIFFSGQTGIYQCEEENTAFAEAAEQAGYRKADRFIEVDMDGVRESMPVIDGMLYAPELPEEYSIPEDDGDPLFADRFSGWTPEEEWTESGYEAAVYPPGSTIAVGDETESLRLYANWEKEFRITTEIQVQTQNELTMYTLVDSETGQPIPRTEGYEINYQWQVCGPEEGQETWEDQEFQNAPAAQNTQTDQSAEDEDAWGITDTDGGELQPPDIKNDIEDATIQDDIIGEVGSTDTVWRDIEYATEAIYQRISDPTDTERYFRVEITAQKISRFRSASEPVVVYSDPVQGEKELVKITVTYEPGDGGIGTAPESRIIDSGNKLSPSMNTFTRASADDGKVFTGWLLTLNGVTAAKPSGTTVENGTLVEANDVALRLTAKPAADAPSVTLTAQWGTATVIYVAADSRGDDNNPGTKESPVKTLAKAYSKLDANASAQTNVVELLTDYTLRDRFWENLSLYRNVTIRGQGKDSTKITLNLTSVDAKGQVFLLGDMIFDSLTLSLNIDFYLMCSGYNLTFNENSAMVNASKYGSDGPGTGVTNGTPRTQILAKHNEGFPSGAVYGPHGTSADDPIRIILSGSDVGVGRFACEGRNMTNYKTSAESPVYVETTLNDGSIGLFIFGGIVDDNNFVHGILNINGGSIYNIAGGNNSYRKSSVTTGSIDVNMTGGHITTLNGGPMGRVDSTYSNTVADVNINISGGTVDTIYMGGSTGTLKGNATANISGGIIGTFYGGGYGKSEFVNPGAYHNGAARITGNVTTAISGGTFNNNVYAGGRGYKDGNTTGSAVIDGNTSLTIMGTADIKGSVFGGGQGLSNDGTAGEVLGDSTVTISGGTIAGNVYGGGEIGTVDGKVTVSILPGAQIGGTIFGGGNTSGSVGSTEVNLNAPFGTSAAPKNIYGAGNGIGTSVTGEASVHVGVGADIYGNVFGGGENGSAGSTSILLTDGTVTGDVFGGGNKADVNGTVSIVQKNSSTVNGNIYGGSNSEKTIKGQVTIDVAGNVNNVYGGGLGEPTAVEGKTQITLSDGAKAAQNIYGGGAQGSITESLITLQGGTVGGNVYGAGNEAGASKTVIQLPASSTDVKGSIYGGSNDKGETAETSILVGGNFAGNIFGGGYGINTTVKNSNITALSGAAPTGVLYGGGEKGKVENSQVVLNGSSHAASVFGGGSEADVTVSALVTVESGAEVDYIYGGSNNSGTVTGAQLAIHGTVTQAYGSGQGENTTTVSPSVTVESGAIVTELYGGGQEGKTTTGTTVVLKDGSRVKNLFGGGNAAGIDGTATVTTEAGSRVLNIYGGSNDKGTVTRSAVTVNGTVGGSGVAGTDEGPGTVYGGGFGANTSTATAEVTVGSAAVLTGDVFGGGAKGPVTGNTTVILSPSSQITGNVYAGGDTAPVGGETLLEARDGAVITGSLFGGGKGKAAVIQKNTRVLAFAHVTGHVFGGGAEGSVTGNTHVDIAKGRVSGDGESGGNVFGGSDRAEVGGDTQVHIGWVAADGTGTDITNASLVIEGTVFGGGNTTDSGSNFDASKPFVLGNSEVSVDASYYDTANFNIVKSIFGDGNMCTVQGTRTVTIKNYKALNGQSNTSIQRANTLTLENSQIELTGAVDSANLVPTIAYSLNRIDHLIMKGGSTLRIQAPVNLVKELVSQDAGGNRVTTEADVDKAAEPDTKNRIDIQQGVQMELRTSEDVTTMEYGAVSGFMVLDVYDPDASKSIESGIYVLGNYVKDKYQGGFLYGSGESRYKMIDPSTDEANWRNWAIGTDMKKTEIMVMSDKPAGGKIVELKSPWPADGSVYRLVQSTAEKPSVTIVSSSGETFVLKDPAALASGDPVDTTLGISINAGNQGWVNPMTLGYIAGDSENGADGGGFGGLATESMQTLNNRAINPTILVELTNRGGISKTDADYPLTVTFLMEKVKLLSDGGFSVQGTLTVELQIRREAFVTYDDILISTGKEYVRGIQTYTFATMEGKAGATISQKSSITLQYGKKDDSGVAASDHRLSFSYGDMPTSAGTSMKLPAGVTILAVDRSGDEPVYAHYTVPSGGVAEVKLSQFVKNGTSEPYVHHLNYYDKENYLFILDFADAPDDFSQDRMCATFEPIYDSGSSVTVKPAKILFSVTSGQQTYKISSSDATGFEKEGISYERDAVIPLTLSTYAEGGGSGIDTAGIDTEMGVYLRLRSRDTGGYVPVPTNWFVTREGKKTGELTGGGISVVLGNAMMGSTSSLGINMKPGSLSAGRYQWEIYLTSSAMAAYPGRLTGTPLYLNFNITDKRYSIQADYQDSSASRLYPAVSTETRQPLLMHIRVKLEYGATADGVIERASLWKKDQNTGEYIQADFGTLFENLTGNSKDYGLEDSRDLSYTLKDVLPEGTYRLKYELIQTGGGAEQFLTCDTENFIVTP